MDIKLAFEQYDMTPGASGRRFLRNLLLHGGKADTHGYSLADCFLRSDCHAVAPGQSAALPPPIGTIDSLLSPAFNFTPAQLIESHRLRRSRLRESFKLIVAHISDDSTLQLLGDPLSQYFQN